MSLRHAILGFLSSEPMSGYDLRKAIEASVAHFWPADQAQIYRTQKELVRDGLVVVEEIEQASRPNRRLHHITDEGRGELIAWICQQHPLSAARAPFLIKIFFGDLVSRNDLAVVLDARRKEAEALCRTLTQIASSIPGDGDLGDRLRVATVENGILHAKAEITWIDHMQSLLEESTE